MFGGLKIAIWLAKGVGMQIRSNFNDLRSNPQLQQDIMAQTATMVQPLVEINSRLMEMLSGQQQMFAAVLAGCGQKDAPSMVRTHPRVFHTVPVPVS